MRNASRSLALALSSPFFLAALDAGHAADVGGPGKRAVLEPLTQ